MNPATDPDIFYYNLSLGNLKDSAGDGVYNWSPAAINARGTDYILKTPDDYYGSLTDFEIPAALIPLVEINIQTPVLDRNLTINSFTLTYGAYESAQTFLIWTPEVKDTPIAQLPPENGALVQDRKGEYYSCYNYTTFIAMMNTALNTAMLDLSAQAGLDIPSPIFVYDAKTNLISLYTDIRVTNQTDPATNLNIWYNTPLQNYMIGFAATFYTTPIGTGIGTNGKDNLISLSKGYGLDRYSLIAPNGDPWTGQQTSAQYSSFALWSPVKSIVIATNMAIQSEVDFINNTTALQSLQYNNILMTYSPDYSNINTSTAPGILSGNIKYSAQSLFRVFSFINGNTPLYNLDVSCFWSDNWGNAYPIYLDKFYIATFKFQFIKKSIFAGFVLDKEKKAPRFN